MDSCALACYTVLWHSRTGAHTFQVSRRISLIRAWKSSLVRFRRTCSLFGGLVDVCIGYIQVYDSMPSRITSFLLLICYLSESNFGTQPGVMNGPSSLHRQLLQHPQKIAGIARFFGEYEEGHVSYYWSLRTTTWSVGGISMYLPTQTQFPFLEKTAYQSISHLCCP